MRRLGVVILLLVSLAAPARAQYGSVRLAWNDCGSAGTSARAFACNTNTGSDVLHVSFQPGNATDAVYRFDTVVVIGYESFAAIPDWWSFVPVTGCRRGSLLASADFTASSGACADPWMGQAFTSLSVTTAYLMEGSYRRHYLRVSATLPTAAAVPLDPATEYYGVRLTLNHQKTVGAGACGGCAQSVCLALDPYGSRTYADPANPVQTSLYPSFGYSVVWNGEGSCDRLVPVKNRTWGALKSLYE